MAFTIGTTIQLGSLVLRTADGAFNGQGYSRKRVADRTIRVAGYTPRNSAILEGSIHPAPFEFLFDLNLRLPQYETLLAQYESQQSTRTGITLIDSYQRPFGTFGIWIDEPPFEVAGSEYDVGSDSNCKRVALIRVAFSAVQIP